jgi:integrase
MSRGAKPPDKTSGIEIRHARHCGTRKGTTCTCTPSYRAVAWSKRDKRLVRKTFKTEAAAHLWREDARVDLRRGVLVAPRPTRLEDIGEAWLAAATEGGIRNRSGDRYKPSTLRGYEQALREYVYPALGAAKLQDVRAGDVQRLVDELVGRGLNPSTVRNALLPLRAICRRALRQGDINANPTTGVEIPAVRGRRDRIVTPDEALRLIDGAPDDDQALWATAFYAGLRRGELQALAWADVDLAKGLISVERSWDQKQGLVEPKSAAGRRRVPIAAVLRDYLVRHRLNNPNAHRVFGRRTDDTPFSPSTIAQRAERAWEGQGLRPVTLHECRHTFATLMIAAGVNAKALQTFMGHSSITVTLDRYGHLFPGSEQQAADLLDAYLADSANKARAAEIEAVGKLWEKTYPQKAVLNGFQRS